MNQVLFSSLLNKNKETHNFSDRHA